MRNIKPIYRREVGRNIKSACQEKVGRKQFRKSKKMANKIVERSEPLTGNVELRATKISVNIPKDFPLKYNGLCNLQGNGMDWNFYKFENRVIYHNRENYALKNNDELECKLCIEGEHANFNNAEKLFYTGILEAEFLTYIGESGRVLNEIENKGYEIEFISKDELKENDKKAKELLKQGYFEGRFNCHWLDRAQERFLKELLDENAVKFLSLGGLIALINHEQPEEVIKEAEPAIKGEVNPFSQYWRLRY